MTAPPMLEFNKENFLKLRARNLALGKIAHETRFGEVEGISFDLRHSEIDPDEWVMDHLGGYDDLQTPRRTETLPFLWFPWYGTFDLDKVKAEVLAEFRAVKEYAKNGPPTPREVYGHITDAEYENFLREEKKQRGIPKTWMKDELCSRIPDAIVNQGDCVKSHRVVKYISEDQFIHAHDGAEIHLHVEIINKIGLTKVIGAPIVMYGSTKLTNRFNHKNIYSILDRVKKYHKLSKIDRCSVKSASDNYTKGGPAHNALYRAAKIYERVLPRVWKWLHSDSNRRANIGSEFLNALDDACMLGYSWAYAETGQHMRPLALAAAASRVGAARAGQASGARRRAQAADTWHRLVKEEALRIRAGNPDASQAKLADEIKFKFDDEAPSHPIIVRYIARLEREGGLPRRRK
jgi:hypothetical protein